jgi:hypothetical protein
MVRSQAAVAAPAVTPAVSRPYNLKFSWVPAEDGARARQTTVKVQATNWSLAIQIALRALALDRSIPADATIRSIKL